MLAVPYFRQYTDYSCGPVTVRMVLAYFGLEASEQSLIRETRADPASGTDNSWIAEALRAHGLESIAREDASLDDIQSALVRGTPVIVNYINPENGHGHFAVVTDCDTERITLNDPRNGEGYHLQDDEFLSRWHSGDGKHVRWMCVASPMVR